LFISFIVAFDPDAKAAAVAPPASTPSPVICAIKSFDKPNLDSFFRFAVNARIAASFDFKLVSRLLALDTVPILDNDADDNASSLPMLQQH